MADDNEGAGASSSVTGGAFGYFTNVGLFGGPPTVRGAGQSIPPASAASASPVVTLPPGGSSTPVTSTDSNGAMAMYGPAIIFAGRPPKDPNLPIPPSGAITVTTKGKKAVTSSATVKNVGPGPFTATSVRSTCHAAKSGVTGSTTITKGVLATATDADGNVTASVTLPTHPPVNYTVTGETGSGDTFKAVFNEQVVDANGAITVNAVHLYLLGPTAIGDVVIARSSAWV